MNVNEFYERYGKHIYRTYNMKDLGFGNWQNLHPNPRKLASNILDLSKLDINNKYRFKYCEIKYPIGHISAVLYQENFITFAPIFQNTAVISFQFSGCRMAKFRFENQWYCCHIYCATGNSGDCKSAWNSFMSDYYGFVNDLILFDPTEGDNSRWSSNFREINASLCGLITPDNQCCSFVMNTNFCKIISPSHIWHIIPRNHLYI